MSWVEQLQETRPHWASEPTMEEITEFVILRKLGGDRAALEAIRKMASHIRIGSDDIDRNALEIFLSRDASPQEGMPECSVMIKINPDIKEVSVFFQTFTEGSGRHLLFRTFLRKVDKVVASVPDGASFYSRNEGRYLTVESGGEVFSGHY